MFQLMHHNFFVVQNNNSQQVRAHDYNCIVYGLHTLTSSRRGIFAAHDGRTYSCERVDHGLSLCDVYY